VIGLRFGAAPGGTASAGRRTEAGPSYTGHGSGLGVFRWVAERTISWLHGFSASWRFVTRRPSPMQYAFFDLALALICFRSLEIPEPHAIPLFL